MIQSSVFGAAFGSGIFAGYFAIQTAVLALRLDGYIEWGWIWVLSPSWGFWGARMAMLIYIGGLGVLLEHQASEEEIKHRGGPIDDD